jgi:hypothetical protein
LKPGWDYKFIKVGCDKVNNIMKEFPFEAVAKFPEGSNERRAEKAAQLIRQADADIAVEVYHEAHGENAEPGTKEAKELEEKFHSEARRELETLLSGSDLYEKALELYNKFASGEKDADEAGDEMRKLLLSGGGESN